jgi:transposase
MSEIKKIPELKNGRRIQYDEDFKRQVLEVWNSGIYATIVECAKSYNINENTLYNWLHRAGKSQEVMGSNIEIVKLRKELSRAKMELDILKKAAIYFANHAK